jgi:hypothetical protein
MATKQAPRSRRGTVAEHESEMGQARRPSALTHDQIAQRAHDIWLQRGRPDGEDKQNWYEAEAQLKHETGSW